MRRRAEETEGASKQWLAEREDLLSQLRRERERSSAFERSAKAESKKTERLRKLLETLEQSIANVPPSPGGDPADTGDASIPAVVQLQREVQVMRARATRRACMLEDRDQALEALERRVEANKYAHSSETKRLRGELAKRDKLCAAKDRELVEQSENFRKTLEELKLERQEEHNVLYGKVDL